MQVISESSVSCYSYSVPILDFWGPYAKLSPGGGGVVGGCRGMDETHLSVFHSVSNRARGGRSRNSISSRYAFNSYFIFFKQEIVDIHVTRFLHRERDSAPH